MNHMTANVTKEGVKRNSFRKDMTALAGSGILLLGCLHALYLFFSYWFSQCASVPTNWNLLLFGRG